jgi:hypothetical protein
MDRLATPKSILTSRITAKISLFGHESLSKPDAHAIFYGREAAVKVPRFRITWLMAFIAIAALELLGMRALSGLQFQSRLLTQVTVALIVGTLPMANILAVGLLTGLRRRNNRPFLLGFEVFGATALALYIAAVSLFPEELVSPAFDLVRERLIPLLWSWPSLSLVVLVVLCFTMMAILLLPQLAFALIGGFLLRNLRVRSRSA